MPRVPVVLSPQRQAILQAIDDFHHVNGYAPSVREVMHITGYASTDPVHRHLTILRKHGLVDWQDGRNRTLKVLKES